MISTLTFAYASEDGVESAAGEVNAQTDASTADGYDIDSYESNTFTALNDKLTDGNEDISINNDYHYDNKSDMYFSDGISIENKSIKINGNNHVIDGTSINTIFQISNSNVEICNLTLYNVNQNTINLENSTLTTNNVIFSGENQEYRAVYMFNSSYTSDGDTFIDSLHEYGSAIYGDTSYLNLNNATFENDRDNIWGLVYLDNGEFKITDTVFNDITSKYSTAIYAWNSMGSIENCEFINLYANLTAGAIGFKSPESTILIQNCSFVNTTAPKNGGAIYVDFNTKIKNNATIVINDCQFIDCTSSFGGAIVQLEGTLQINNSNFTDNLALYKGGAIHTSYANVEINDCLFENNEVILLDEGITQGGAVYFDYGNLRIFNSTFKNSSADEGKSLYANEANYTIRDSYFENGIYTRFDEEVAELSNNIFVNEDENTLDEREYYTVYDGVGVQFDIDPFIIGEGNLTADYFNLVDYGLVSPVSNQGSNGACWAFMTTGALESAILKATNKKLLLDISENNIQNTGLKYSPIGDNDLIEFGAGNVATSYLLSWLGMTSTEDDVYDELGKLSPVIDNSSKYYIYEIVTLPKYTIDGISTLKKALIDYGAIGIGVLGASGGEEENYNEYTSAAYESETTTMNHGVTLVGWNDTFSRDNFKVTPPGDGAWIIKNSWGTDWGDNGYYYVSYYDKAIGYEDYPFAIIVNNPTYPYEKNYQYDPIADINLNGYTDYEITSYMNIYEAVDDDLIAAVGTYFKDAGIEYVIEVQTDNMTYQQKGISKHHGFETIALDKFIPIYNGSSFIVKNYVDYVPLTADYRNKVPPESSFINTTKGWIDLVANDNVASLKAYTIPDYSYLETNNLTTKYGSGEYVKVKYFDENGDELTDSTVLFKINGKTYERTTDENAIATLNVTLPVGEYIVTAVNPINLKEYDISLIILSDDRYDADKVINNKVYKQLQRSFKQIHSNDVHKILLDNKVLVKSNVLTLDGLNRIFNQSFINGHLLVYVDGQLVYNDTVGDDLGTIIFEIIEKFLGEHEIKVVFTDNNNETKTYVENVTII